MKGDHVRQLVAAGIASFQTVIFKVRDRSEVVQVCAYSHSKSARDLLYKPEFERFAFQFHNEGS